MRTGASPSAPPDAPPPGPILRVLSLNIQVGLHSTGYRQYVTQAWRHLLPSRRTRAALNVIGALAGGYDAVALQEADAGSFRTAGLNQVAFLAGVAGLDHWHAAVNRNLKPFAQHCLGYMGRDAMRVVQHCALPGWPKGRGALEIEITRAGYQPLRLVIAHLALGQRSRRLQLSHLAGMVEPGRPTLVVGDFNCPPAEIAAHPAMRAAGLRVTQTQPTFPAWRPRRCLDHVLASPGVSVLSARVLDDTVSDHLAVATEVRLAAG